MPIIRPVGGARRSSAVKQAAAQREADRQALKGKTTLLDDISKGKGKATPAQTRDAVADLAEALKGLPGLL